MENSLTAMYVDRSFSISLHCGIHMIKWTKCKTDPLCLFMSKTMHIRNVCRMRQLVVQARGLCIHVSVDYSRVITSLFLCQAYPYPPAKYTVDYIFTYTQLHGRVIALRWTADRDVAVRHLAMSLSCYDCRQVVQIHAPVTKQYNLVLAKGWWCSAAVSLLPGLWLKVTCRPTAYKQGSAQATMLVSNMGLHLSSFRYTRRLLSIKFCNHWQQLTIRYTRRLLSIKFCNHWQQLTIRYTSRLLSIKFCNHWQQLTIRYTRRLLSIKFCNHW